MPRPTRSEIELRGRVTARILRPVVDDFRIEPTAHGTTLLTGVINDASHLNGLLAHFTSMNVDVVGLRVLDDHDDHDEQDVDPTSEPATTSGTTAPGTTTPGTTGPDTTTPDTTTPEKGTHP